MSTAGCLRPVGDRLIVLPDPEESQSSSGLFLVRHQHLEGRRSKLATVLAAGPGAWMPVESEPGVPKPGRFRWEEMPYKPGDRVILNPWVGRAGMSEEIKRPWMYDVPEGALCVRLLEVQGCVEPNEG